MHTCSIIMIVQCVYLFFLKKKNGLFVCVGGWWNLLTCCMFAIFKQKLLL